MVEQKSIYSDRNVIITNHLATLFGVSYPLRAISSIKIKRTSTERQMLALIGGIFALSGIFLLADCPFRGISELFNISDMNRERLSGLIIMIVGFALFVGAFFTTPDFKLILVTNAREGVVMKSRNLNYIQHIRRAIEQAVAGAG
jgi:hypothetical protein